MNTRIALLGQPNSGKSTVYNALTGSRQHVGNWPGKTVEKNDGFYIYNGTRYTVTDLPGSYGLSGNSDEEVITADFIRSGQADLICILVDASQLERSMFMTAEFAASNIEASDFWWNLAKGSVLVGGVEEEGDRAAVASFIRNNWDKV